MGTRVKELLGITRRLSTRRWRRGCFSEFFYYCHGMVPYHTFGPGTTYAKKRLEDFPVIFHTRRRRRGCFLNFFLLLHGTILLALGSY